MNLIFIKKAKTERIFDSTQQR